MARPFLSAFARAMTPFRLALIVKDILYLDSSRSRESEARPFAAMRASVVDFVQTVNISKQDILKDMSSLQPQHCEPLVHLH